MCPVGDPLLSRRAESRRGLAQPTSGRAPPEGALDLRVRGARPPWVGAGTGGLGHTGVCAGNHGKQREPAFPEVSLELKG